MSDQDKLEAAIAALKTEVDALAASTDRDLQRLAELVADMARLDQQRTVPLTPSSTTQATR